MIIRPAASSKTYHYRQMDKQIGDMKKKLEYLEHKLKIWEEKEPWAYSKTRQTLYHTIFDTMDSIQEGERIDKLSKARSFPRSNYKLSEMSGETRDSLVASGRFEHQKKQRFSEIGFLRIPSASPTFSPRITRDY